MSRLLALACLATMSLPSLRSQAFAASSPSAIPDEVTHLRDPFKKPTAGPKTIPRSPLELYSVDKFKLLAVMTGPRRLRAMVAAPNGKSYLVWENMHIGLRKGIVRRITPDAIHVREQVVNVLGQEESVDSEIRMSETLEASGSATTGNTLTDQPAATSGRAAAPSAAAADSGAVPAAPSADAGASISVAPAPESAPVPAVAAPAPEAAPAPVVPASPDAKPGAGSASGTGTGTAAPGAPSGG